HIAGVALTARPFPVDIYAVEDAEGGAWSTLRLTTNRRQIALDEQINAACHEGTPVGWQRRVGEELRPGPAAQREDHLEVRELLFELLELVEVAGKRLVEDVCDAVNRLIGAKPALVVGPGIALAELVGLEAEPLFVDIAEGVVDVRQLARHPSGVQILHLKVTSVDAPLGEVCDRLERPDRRWHRIGSDSDRIAGGGDVTRCVAGLDGVSE